MFTEITKLAHNRYIKVSEDIDWTIRPTIGRVYAEDADEGLNSIVHYSGKIFFFSFSTERSIIYLKTVQDPPIA